MKIAPLILIFVLMMLGRSSVVGQTSLDQKSSGAKLVSDDLTLKPPPFWMNYQGKIYQNMELTGVEGDVAVFSTTAGPLRIKWSEAPSNLHDRFYRDFLALSAKAAAAAAHLAAQIAYGQGIAPGTVIQVNGTVVQKIPDGLLIVYDKQPALLCGHPDEASLAENSPVTASAVFVNWFRYMTTGGEVAMVRRLKVAQPAPQ
ncbi:MAG: hypothetical protein WCD79_11860 [Chthoniobacteraceae bacterium]